MVFQSAALFDSLSVYENVAYPLREHRDWPEPQIAERVASCLEAVGLPGCEALLPAELSGGMRKRVGVARAIALEPRAILYDEPTTGLDPANQKRIGELIRRAAAPPAHHLGDRHARARALLRDLEPGGAAEGR